MIINIMGAMIMIYWIFIFLMIHGGTILEKRIGELERKERTNFMNSMKKEIEK